MNYERCLELINLGTDRLNSHLEHDFSSYFIISNEEKYREKNLHNALPDGETPIILAKEQILTDNNNYIIYGHYVETGDYVKIEDSYLLNLTT